MEYLIFKVGGVVSILVDVFVLCVSGACYLKRKLEPFRLLAFMAACFLPVSFHDYFVDGAEPGEPTPLPESNQIVLWHVMSGLCIMGNMFMACAIFQLTRMALQRND